MTKRYVIFKVGRVGNAEFRHDEQYETYLHADQEPKTDLGSMLHLLEVTDDPDEAMAFPTAREAYEWAGEHKLDWWKVGVR